MTTEIASAVSPQFFAVPFKGTIRFSDIAKRHVTQQMKDAVVHAPRGNTISWGIPFKIDRPILVQERQKSVYVDVKPFRAQRIINAVRKAAAGRS